MVKFNESQYKKDLMAEGGEGRIYNYKNDHVIKVYKKMVDKKDKQEKLKIIMKKNLPSNVIKPIELVYNNGNRFIGYMMKKVRGEEFKRLSSKKYVISHNITKENIANMLVQVKETIKILHDKGIYIGDLNDVNILFDKIFQVYFIDIDSWSVDNQHKCTVANDMFKDPELVSNNFNAGTDDYAFAILVYKSLTRCHPFGGVIKSMPIMNLINRMKQRLSIFSVDDIIIPPMVDKDIFLSSNIKDKLKEIFIDNKRFLIDSSLDDLNDNLTYCKNHDDFYYSLYNKCPVCDTNAKEAIPLVNLGKVGGIPVRLFFTNLEIKIIFNENTYLNTQNHVVFKNTNKKTKLEPNCLYYMSNLGDIFFKIEKEVIKIKTEEKDFKVQKLFNSKAIVRDNSVYFISRALNLTKFGVLGMDSSYENVITKVSINNIFNIIDPDNYFICNVYDNTKIIEINGNNHQLNNSDKITEYGIHYDEVSKQWLFIFENQKGEFFTWIFDKKSGILYSSKKIRFTGKLSHMCFYNKIIFKPANGKIIGFNHEKSEYKEFEVPVISEETDLIKHGKKFLAINEKEIYEIG